jgi:hypothetical protein
VLGAGLWFAKADAGQPRKRRAEPAVSATDAMPEGGKLTIETSNAALDEDYAALHGDMKGQPRAELLGETMGMFASNELGNYDSMANYVERAIRIARQLGANASRRKGWSFAAVSFWPVAGAPGRRNPSCGPGDVPRARLQFCGPKLVNALATAIEDEGERTLLPDPAAAGLRPADAARARGRRPERRRAGQVCFVAPPDARCHRTAGGRKEPTLRLALPSANQPPVTAQHSLGAAMPA